MANVHLEMLKKERNVYEAADLSDQNRFSVADLMEDLASPVIVNGKLTLTNDHLQCEQSKQRFPVVDNVIDFRNVAVEEKGDAWESANEEFLNYHRSLTVYTLLNSLPLINYLRERTGIAEIEDATVIDVGAGTGHTLCSFFKNPSTLRYYNLDPNLRLLHDQFIRIYPDLLQLKMGHILCFAEKLPFRDGCADLVMSLSSIDHFKDYEAFMREAFRVLKPEGRIFISSHLDLPPDKRVQRVATTSKLFGFQFWERVARYLYYRKYRVGDDDHTFHFEDVQPMVQGLEKAGFTIVDHEEFLGNFWITAVKH